MTASQPTSEIQDSEAEVDAALADLVEGEKRWAALPLSGRIALLDRLRDLVVEHAQAWVDAAIVIKKLDRNSQLVGEEWISGPYSVAGGATALSASLAKIASGESPLGSAKFTKTTGGRTAVRVLPSNIFDTLLLNGFSADVWLQPGVDSSAAVRNAGLGQLDPPATNGVGAVLGAGNIMSIAPLDTIYELFAQNRVVALKLNPVTDPLFPVFKKVFAPFIEIGAVRILTGGAEVGGYLVNHKLVDHVHMTGSATTHDAIVFGRGEEGARRRAANQPILDKPMTSELGGVSPVIVVPGKWSSADIEFQAAHVATQRLHNCGYNCVAAQVAVISSEWEQKDEFLAALRAAIESAPERPAYYPGSDDRVAGALKTYPDAEKLGARDERVLVCGLDAGEYAPLLETEYFSPVFGVVELPHTGVEFLNTAVDLANDKFIGTLGVNIIAHPKTMKSLGGALDSAIERLRYGTIALNAWTGVGFLTPAAAWGAFPGHTIDDVQSGIGVVHNALLIDKVERTVVRGPFRPAPRSILNGELTLAPKPPWFVNNKTAAKTGELLTRFAGKPSWAKLPAIFASALRG